MKRPIGWLLIGVALFAGTWSVAEACGLEPVRATINVAESFTLDINAVALTEVITFDGRAELFCEDE